MDMAVTGHLSNSVNNSLGFYPPGSFQFILVFTAALPTPLPVGKQSGGTKCRPSITPVRAQWVAVDQEELAGLAGA